QLESGKYAREADVRFGLAHALLRDDRLAEAKAEIAALRRLKLDSPLLENLAAQLELKRKDSDAAIEILQAASRRYPDARAIAYALIEAKIGAGGTAHAAEAAALAREQIESTPGDARLHALLAKAYAAQGKRLRQHRAQAEAYLAEGLLDEAILQLEIARQANDGDFYEQSEIDARLRELRQRKMDLQRSERNGKP
ncbi:MAG: M48 family peptidase, partial [Rhodocyclaceae bacterium]